MIEPLLLATAIAALLLVSGGAATLYFARRAASAPTVTARHQTRRAGRDAAIVAGVRLAVEMARCDGEVHAREMDAIHDFLTEHVKRRDVPWAARVMRAGLEDPRNPETLEAALQTVEQLDPERRDLVLKLMVWVARADGLLRDEERSFLVRVAERAGLGPDRVEALLDKEP